MKVEYERIRDNVEGLLKEKRITQRELAGKISMSEALISRILHGERNLSLQAAADIADVLGCSIDYIVGHTTPADVPAIGVVKESGNVVYMRSDTWKMFRKIMEDQFSEE